MHRDRRRAGRAIRKARREAYQQTSALAMAAVAELANAAAKGMATFGRIFREAGEAFASTARTITFAPAPGGTATVALATETGRPSHSGVTRASEAHSGSESEVPK